MAGYALARLRFRGRNAVFGLLLFSMMIPQQVTFISNYLVLRDGVFGLSRLVGVPTLLNTYSGLIISGLVGASSVFIMKQFFERLPASLEESARIDGASTYTIFFSNLLAPGQASLGSPHHLDLPGGVERVLLALSGNYFAGGQIPLDHRSFESAAHLWSGYF